jgi:competence protein ComEC
MRVMMAFLFGLSLIATPSAAQTRKTLDIYLIDVEGGGATLFVAPSGETVLIDTGNGGGGRSEIATRDADRILAAARDAGVKQIDHLITTHWHGDHFGAMTEVADRLPIKEFIDHGDTIQPQPASTAFLEKIYPGLYAKSKHTIAKPGDRIAIAGLEWRILSSDGNVIKAALPGGGRPNPYCSEFKAKEIDAVEDKTENAQSVGSHITFGRFRVLHLGDLTVMNEIDMMCPNNPIGTVDLFVVSHHGQPISNSKQLVHAIQARVAILNNGTRKGGQPEFGQVIHSSPGLEDLWQLHFSLLSGQEYTVPNLFIANGIDDQPLAVPIEPLTPPPAGAPPAPLHNGPAHWIKVSAQQDGTFTVTNTRNGFAKTYKATK